MRTLVHLSPLASVGGCEVNCLRIIEGLGEYRHRILVFADQDKMSADWEKAGATVEYLGAWNKSRGQFKRRFASWMKSQEDIFGVFYWSTSRLPMVLASIEPKNGTCVVYLGNPADRRLIRTASLLFQSFQSRAPGSVRFVACSEQVASSYRRAPYFRRFPIQVIYNAVGAKFDQEREYRDLPVGSIPVVGMVARLDSIKDQITIIRALARIRSVRKDIIVEFAGDGARRDALIAEVMRFGLNAQVRFLGVVSGVAERLAGWDLYLHSTTPAEGMGTALAEAMATGLPCLVSDLAVMREVCGADGAHFAPAGDAQEWGEALVSLLADRRRRIVLGRAARQRARLIFEQSCVARRYEQVVSGSVEVGSS